MEIETIQNLLPDYSHKVHDLVYKAIHELIDVTILRFDEEGLDLIDEYIIKLDRVYNIVYVEYSGVKTEFVLNLPDNLYNKAH